MADTGWKSPTATGSNFNSGDTPTEAYSSNDAYMTLSASGTSGLYINGPEGYSQDYYNFDFNIPAGSTINGIEISNEGNFTNNDAFETSVEVGIFDLTNSGDGSGYYFKRDTGFITSDLTDTTRTVGGATETFGKTWSDTDFSNSKFGIWIGHSGFIFAHAFQLDHIQVKVYYTAPTTSPFPSFRRQ